MQNNSLFKEKILQFIDFKGINKAKFYRETGITRSTLDKKTGLSEENITKFFATYPEVSTDWLLKNEEPMLKRTDILEEAPLIYDITKKNGVPFYDVDFIAGDLETFDNQSVTPEYYMDIPEFKGCVAFRAYSNSMEEKIVSGSILFGTKIDNWLEHLEYGQIYGIIANDGRRYLKYIRKFIENPSKYFTLKSENKDYDDFEIPKKEIRSIWLINGWLNRTT